MPAGTIAFRVAITRIKQDVLLVTMHVKRDVPLRVGILENVILVPIVAKVVVHGLATPHALLLLKIKIQ